VSLHASDHAGPSEFAYISRGEFPLDGGLLAELQRRRSAAYLRVALGLALMFGTPAIGVALPSLPKGVLPLAGIGACVLMAVGVMIAISGGIHHRSAIVNLRHGRFERFELNRHSSLLSDAVQYPGPRLEFADSVDVYAAGHEVARIGTLVCRGLRRIRILEATRGLRGLRDLVYRTPGKPSV
jgi:hypothetical protein